MTKSEPHDVQEIQAQTVATAAQALVAHLVEVLAPLYDKNKEFLCNGVLLLLTDPLYVTAGHTFTGKVYDFFRTHKPFHISVAGQWVEIELLCNRHSPSGNGSLHESRRWEDFAIAKPVDPIPAVLLQSAPNTFSTGLGIDLSGSDTDVSVGEQCQIVALRPNAQGLANPADLRLVVMDATAAGTTHQHLSLRVTSNNDAWTGGTSGAPAFDSKKRLIGLASGGEESNLTKAICANMKHVIEQIKEPQPWPLPPWNR